MSDYIGKSPAIHEALQGTTLITHDNGVSFTPTNNQLVTNPAISVNGTLTAARNLILPIALNTYIISNSTVGGFTLTVKTASGSGVTIIAGNTMIVKSDGTNIVPVTSLDKVTTGDIFSDFVVSGLLSPTSATLSSTISAGVAYVTGLRIVKAAEAFTYTASVDTYEDLASTGVITRIAVATGAAAPALTANNLRLQKVVTSATAVTAVTQLAALTSNAPKVIVGTATNATNATNLLNTAPLKLPSITATTVTGALTFSAASRYLDFAKAALTDGTNDTLLAAPANLVLPSGGTLGTPTGTNARIVVIEMNVAGVAELTIVNLAGGNDLSETGLISTTAISATSTANNVFYSTTARTGVAYRVVGIVDAVNTTGAWAAPTLVRGASGNGVVSAAGGKLIKFTIITASNAAWAKQAGTTTIICACRGGDGGGGGASGSGDGTNTLSGGTDGVAGSGSRHLSYARIDSPTATLSAVIGAPGAGGAVGVPAASPTNGANGTSGGATSFGGVASSPGGTYGRGGVYGVAIAAIVADAGSIPLAGGTAGIGALTAGNAGTAGGAGQTPGLIYVWEYA